jgi:hypothetical protein
MLSKLAMISFEELKFVTPRIFLYAGVAYAATRLVKVGMDQASRLLGLENNTR